MTCAETDHDVGGERNFKVVCFIMEHLSWIAMKIPRLRSTSGVRTVGQLTCNTQHPSMTSQQCVPGCSYSLSYENLKRTKGLKRYLGNTALSF